MSAKEAVLRREAARKPVKVEKPKKTKPVEPELVEAPEPEPEL